MAGLLRRGKKKEENTDEELEEMVETTKETEIKRFPKAENFRKLGQDVFNALPIMRENPHYKFALLGVVLTLIRPWNQRYDEYSPEQLVVLEDLYSTELQAVRDALMRKIPK
jgi:hypothetical protein